MTRSEALSMIRLPAPLTDEEIAAAVRNQQNPTEEG